MKTSVAALIALGLVAVVALSTSAAAADLGNVISTLQASGLTAYLSMAQVADLQKVLSTYGSVTLLVPNNVAWEALGLQTLQTLAQDYNIDWAQMVMMYHLLQTPFGRTILISMVNQKLPTVLGQKLLITQDGGGGLMIGDAKIVQSDIPFLNGNTPSIIHVIDKVLMPPGGFSLIAPANV
jgi:uncharacterized surface protein with fasciclin (FAS1) repeats